MCDMWTIREGTRAILVDGVTGAERQAHADQAGTIVPASYFIATPVGEHDLYRNAGPRESLVGADYLERGYALLRRVDDSFGFIAVPWEAMDRAVAP